MGVLKDISHNFKCLFAVFRIGKDARRHGMTTEGWNIEDIEVHSENRV